MDGEITIVSAGPTSNQKYRVLSHHSSSNKIQSGSFGIDELLRFINELKPEIITIFTADMHARTIVTFLEYFLSRKFKSVIHELSLHRRGMIQSRIIIIKMKKYV